jgi:hypothetical protein
MNEEDEAIVNQVLQEAAEAIDAATPPAEARRPTAAQADMATVQRNQDADRAFVEPPPAEEPRSPMEQEEVILYGLSPEQKALYRGRHCLVRENDERGRWWMGPSMGYTIIRGEAHIYKVGAPLLQMRDIYYILPLVRGEIIKPPKLGCKLEQWFDAAFISLMQDAPGNQVTRGHMMRVLKIEPPLELATFDQLKDWVEKSFPERIANSRWQENPAYTPATVPYDPFNVGTGRPPDIQRPPTGPVLAVAVSMSQIANGRCRYSVQQTARVNWAVTTSEIQDAIDNGVGDIDGLLDYIREQASNVEEIGWVDDGGHDYDHYEESGSDGIETQIRGSETVARELRRFVIDNMPDSLEDLNIEME